MKYLDSMERSLLKRIDDLHEPDSHETQKGKRFLKLLFLYGVFAIHRAGLILLSAPTKSFTQLHPQNSNGEWPVSYVDHLRFCIRMRLYALGSLLFVSGSIAMGVIALQINDTKNPTFALTLIQTPMNQGQNLDDDVSVNEDDETESISEPDEENEQEIDAEEENENDTSPIPQTGTNNSDATTRFSSASFDAASVVTMTVTNTDATGAGSLDDAIDQINALSASDSYVIELSVSGTIELTSTLSTISRQVDIQNTSGGDVVIDGSLINGSCIEFGLLADNSSMSGVDFENCDLAILIQEADGTTIGTSSDPVSIGGGDDGISIDNSDDVTLSSVDVGTSALTGTGIFVGGDNALLQQIGVTDVETGVDILATADGTTIEDSTIGTLADGSGAGIDTNGIIVLGANTTIGGTTTQEGNTIVLSGGAGIVVDGADNAHIQNNVIGTASQPNTEAGISLILDADDSAVITENIMEGNGEQGIVLQGGTDVEMTDNTIAQNGNNGILVSDGATDVTIGGAGVGNTIEENTGNGVAIAGSATERVHVTQNSFANNSLDPIAITQGANDGLTPPTIASVSSTLIAGDDAPSGGVVEVYMLEDETLTYIGHDTTIGNGGAWSVRVAGSFRATQAEGGFSGATIDADVAGKEIFVLAIDADTNTSEFSEGVTVAASGNAFELSTTATAKKTTARIVSETSVQTTARLRYGLSADHLQYSIQSDRGRVHVFSVEELRPDTTYYYRVTATNTSGDRVRSSVREFSTNSTDPAVTSLTGDYSVTTNPAALQFQGTAEYTGTTQFRFVDLLTNEEFAICNTDDTFLCTLPYTLALGEYAVTFGSTNNNGTITERSAPHRLIVSPDVITDVLTTDKRSDDYLTRLVTSESVTVIGVMPKESTPQVTVNGVAISADAVRTTGSLSFAVDLDLAALGLQRGEDHLIEIAFVDNDTDALVGTAIYYPFKFVTPIEEEIVVDTFIPIPETPVEEEPKPEEETVEEPEEPINPEEPGEEPGEPTEEPESPRVIKERLNRLLRTTLSIEARKQVLNENGTVISEDALTKNTEGQVVLRNVRTVGLRPSSWFSFGKTNEIDVLQITGVSDPFATVTLTIFSDPIVQVTQADAEGKWKINVAVSDLPEGQHTAFLKAESQGVASDEVEIARFVVIQEETLSNTSWIFIINIIIALCILSIIITVRIQHRKEQQRIKEIRAKRKTITPEDLVTELLKKQSPGKEEKDDLHTTLDI